MSAQAQAGGVAVAPANAPVAANVQSAAAAAPTGQYPMASLYVGDLHPNVTESMLYNKFATAGPVLSIRVCRDAITRRSLGYAYVNFQAPADAERALDTMNFDVMHNKPIRIMWSQRDPTIRRSGAGNVFIKNLDPHIDTKSIYDTFSMFGSILSCKIAVDEEGKSKGYGFIHFETEEAAQKAIDKVNGMLLDGKVVFVGKFQPRSARLHAIGETAHSFQNVYVKNFADKLTDDQLQKLFEKYGTVSSCVAMKAPDGTPRGFGFVSFENPDAAQKAVEALNGYELPDTDLKLTVCRAQKKSERAAELERQYESLKAERLQRYAGVNLYVKNLDDSIDSEQLKVQFEPYGEVTSAKVMTDDTGRSKGFGFVCFSKPDDATKAVVDMNNRMLANKPLYVALAQRKEDRKQQLATQYMQRMATMRVANSQMPIYAAAAQQNFYGGMQQPRPYQGLPQMRAGNVARWGVGQTGYGAMPNYVVQPGFASRGARQFVQRGGQQQQFGRQQIGGGRQQIGGQQQRQIGGPQVRQQIGGPQQRQQMQGEDMGSLSTKLANAPPQEAKQILGEALYSKVANHCPDQALVGKLTGMLLEMDNSDLLAMLDNADLLVERVNEAVAVLEGSK